MPPATGAQLAHYADAITDKTSRRGDAPLYEYFCMTTLGSACPADIEAQLKPYMIGTSRISLADAFVGLLLAHGKADPQAPATEEEYVDAAYQVVLGRKPDPAGRAANLAFIKQSGDHGTLLRSMLTSPEFRVEIAVAPGTAQRPLKARIAAMIWSCTAGSR